MNYLKTRKNSFDFDGLLLFCVSAGPDFAEVYSFIGSVFDPDTKGHVQKLKEMDPINFETVSFSIFL